MNGQAIYFKGNDHQINVTDSVKATAATATSPFSVDDVVAAIESAVNPDWDNDGIDNRSVGRVLRTLSTLSVNMLEELSDGRFSKK
jgi:hypothetical protein